MAAVATIEKPAAPPEFLASAVADLLVNHGYPFVPDEHLGTLEKLLRAFLEMLPSGPESRNDSGATARPADQD